MRIWWYIAAMTLILVYLLLIAIFAPPPKAAYGEEAARLLHDENTTEWCYWEKGLAKARLRQADISVKLVPLN